MRTKRCFRCGEVKPMTEFYIHKQMADGRLNKCKPCTRSDVKANRDAKAEAYREYDRRRAKTEHRKRAGSKRTKEQVAAHNAVTRALRSGKLTRPDGCERCGRQDVEAHHDDYSKRLEVMWLCPVCHANRHGELGRLGLHAPRKPDPGPYPSSPNGRSLSEAMGL